jgi:hypothetical protein
MLTLGSVKVAAAHDQTPKRNQRQKKVESDLSGSIGREMEGRAAIK